MPSIDIILLFAATTFIVVLTPGPAAIAVASESARGGSKAGMIATLGVAGANAAYFILSATGISALILASSTLFTIIKWLGVAYLIWLGLQALLSRAGGFTVVDDKSKPRSKAQVFMRGFVIEMANPKALLYFAALLPQFIDPTQPVLSQFLLFGTLTFLLDLTVYSGYALLTSVSTRSGLSPIVGSYVNKGAGVMLIIAGLSMANVERTQ